MARAGVRRIALFAPNSSPRFQEMLWGMRRAFSARDVDCLISWPLLDRYDLAAFCDQTHPDAVIEIDRSRAQAVGLPDPVRHVAWIQNPRCYRIFVSEGFGGSEIVYFMGAAASLGLGPQDHNGSKVGCLLPAVEAAEPPVDTTRRSIDLACLGIVPKPDFGSLLTTGFNVGGRQFFGADIVAALVESGISPSRNSLGAQHDAVRNAFARASGLSAETFDSIFDSRSLEPYDQDVLPSFERERVLDAALDLDAELAFYGNGSWREWPRYAARYRGPLARAEDVRRTFAGCRILVSVGPRPLIHRHMVAMAAGAVLMTNRTAFDHEPTGIAQYFEAGVHYLDYDIDEAGGALAEAVANRGRLERIARTATEELRARHRWIHRVDQILADLRSL